MARTILIADDSPTVQKKASGILTGEGMEVVTVSNGVAAIKKLPTVKPMVILADVSMPGKDGYEVCEFVKASTDFPTVPVILVYSDDDIYDEQKGAKAQADGRIKKPFDSVELINTVTRFLALAEMAQTPVGATMIYKIPPRPRPAPPTEVEPVDEELDYVPKKETDLSRFERSGGFAETPLEDLSATPPSPAAGFDAFMPPEPATPYEPEPAPEPAPSFESAVPLEAPAFAEPEPPPAYPEEPMVAPESPFSAEGAAEPMPEAAPPPPASPPQEEISTEPVFIEEQAAPPPPPAAPPAPEMARTMMFRLSDIAQPVLSDEMAPAPAETPPEAIALDATAPVAEGEQAFPPEPEAPPVSAASLESYSLSDAAAGHVRFAAVEEESPAAVAPEVEEEAPAAVAPAVEEEAPAAVAPAAEEEAPAAVAPEVEEEAPAAVAPAVEEEAPAAVAPEVEEEAPAAVAPEEAVAAPAPAPTPAAIDSAHVYTIVQMVVAKMSPRMGAQAIAEMAKSLADEINAELNVSAAPKP